MNINNIVGNRYMDVRMYEYVIVSKNAQLKQLREEINEFTNELLKNEMFEFDNSNSKYALRPVVQKGDYILFHYYQGSDIKQENYRHDYKSRFDFLNENDLKGIAEIKHLFIFVDLKKQRLYMNHIFQKMEKVRDFLGANSNVFAKKLNIVSSIDPGKITDAIKSINCLEFKTIPEDILEGMINNNLVTELIREPEVKSTTFKIVYKRNLKRIDEYIKSYIKKSINQQNELVISYIDSEDNDCYINTKKMSKNIYLGAFGLSTEDEELAAENHIFRALKDRE